jgi:hypothetical protein
MEMVEVQRRCDRNRKRSKRRAIFCPIHNCYVESVSQKYPLYADRAGQLQERGINRRDALILVANSAAVPLVGEWLEGFWCPFCQEVTWYHVKRVNARYELSPAPAELWQQAIGVSQPDGNPSVGDFTRRQARATHANLKDFSFVNG